MAILSDIRAHLESRLATVSTTSYAFDADRVHSGHKPRSNSDDFITDLIDGGPQAIILPGEIITYDPQFRMGTCKVDILVMFGVDPQVEISFTEIEDFIDQIVTAIGDTAAEYTPMKISATRPKFDQERTNMIEYRITTEGWPYC